MESDALDICLSRMTKLWQAIYMETTWKHSLHIHRYVCEICLPMHKLGSAPHKRRYLKFIALQDALKVIVLHS